MGNASGIDDSAALKAKALALHHSLLTVDTHCDTPVKLDGGWDMGARHTPSQPDAGSQDLPRMKEGGLVASFFAAFIGQGELSPEGYAQAYEKAIRYLNTVEKMCATSPSLCERALCPEDARRIHAQGKRAIFLAMENGYPLGRNLLLVDEFYQRGVRYITLCHAGNNDLCASSGADGAAMDYGLTDLGRQVVNRMNELGMLVDVSHLSEKSFYDVFQTSKAPLFASHSCAKALCDHPRNLSDDQLRAIKKSGGVVQLCLYSGFIRHLSPASKFAQAFESLEKRVSAAGGWGNIQDKIVLDAFDAELMELPRRFRQELASIQDAVDHIDHIVKLIGVDHVGIGTDFDGGGALRDCFEVTELPGITEELMRRGYSDADIAKIWGGNCFRVMEATQKLAVRPSTS